MKKNNYKDATVIVLEPGGKVSGKKYRNIAPWNRKKFETFAKKKFPNAIHINYYNKDGTFQEREVFQ